MKSLQDIIHAVAPPIAEHEIIEVQLSYDMVGYDGIENLVYKSLAKVGETLGEANAKLIIRLRRSWNKSMAETSC